MTATSEGDCWNTTTARVSPEIREPATDSNALIAWASSFETITGTSSSVSSVPDDCGEGGHGDSEHQPKNRASQRRQNGSCEYGTEGDDEEELIHTPDAFS